MITKEITEYVKQQLVLGKTEFDIRRELLMQGGWTTSDLDEVFRNQHGYSRASNVFLVVTSVIGFSLIFAALFFNPLWIILSHIPFILWGFAIGQVVVRRLGISNTILRILLTSLLAIVFCVIAVTVLGEILRSLWPAASMQI